MKQQARSRRNPDKVRHWERVRNRRANRRDELRGVVWHWLPDGGVLADGRLVGTVDSVGDFHQDGPYAGPQVREALWAAMDGQPEELWADRWEAFASNRGEYERGTE